MADEFGFLNNDQTVVQGTCAKCGTPWKAEGVIMPGFADHEDVNCPNCGELQGNYRFDMGVSVSVIKNP